MTDGGGNNLAVNSYGQFVGFPFAIAGVDPFSSDFSASFGGVFGRAMVAVIRLASSAWGIILVGSGATDLTNVPTGLDASREAQQRHAPWMSVPGQFWASGYRRIILKGLEICSGACLSSDFSTDFGGEVAAHSGAASLLQ